MSTYKPNSSNSTIVQETPTGTVNGSNTAFTTLQAKYVANSLEVFVNGLQQTKTTDYAETTPGSGVFTFTVAPLTGDIVKVSYQFSTGASGNADTIDGIHASATPTANQLSPLNATSTYPGSVVKQITTQIQNDTTNTSSAIDIIQRGWGYFVGSGSNNTTETVTLPVAFDDADYDIQVTGLGWKASAPSSRSDFTVAGSIHSSAKIINSSTFTASLSDAAAVMGGTTYFGYSWIAVGKKA